MVFMNFLFLFLKIGYFFTKYMYLKVKNTQYITVKENDFFDVIKTKYDL